MPELPEVEGFRSVVERSVVGHSIDRARFLDDWMLKDSTPSAAARRLRGRRVSAVDRRGKMLALFTDPIDGKTDTPVLAFHFGMDGRPVIARTDAPILRSDRVILDLDSGDQFRFRNTRRLGFVRVVTRNEFADMAWRLGPDPLEAPLSYLVESLAIREAPVKALLLDQSFLAGVGNIYADEALFAARIHPGRPGYDIAEDEAERLHKALRNILKRAVTGQQRPRARVRLPLLSVRNSASRQLGASGSPKVGCPRCTRPLKHTKIGGRTTFFCAHCQR
jgi:formamidopyrimidine-DNA glycosylase